MSGSEKRQDRQYVGDYGTALEGVGAKTSVSFGMVVLALAIGCVIGFLVWGALWLSSALTNFVWAGVNEGSAPWFMPLVLCTGGGLAIGLWSKYVGGDPAPLEEVMAEVKQTGSYKLESIPASVAPFLLPLVFGGSIGLEAGLTGLIAAATCWIGDTLKRAGLKVKSVADLTISAGMTAIFGAPFAGIVSASEDAMPDAEGEELPDPRDYTFRRAGKIVLYSASAFGAFAGATLLTELVGGMAGIPRFDAIDASGADLAWALPCMLAAYALTWVYFVSRKGSQALASRLGRFTVLKPLACGAVMGALAIWLPKVLFCGEEQAYELQENWQLVGAGVLLATGFVKAALTSLCLNMGWRGGSFFPNIYAGISCGYGIALISGADPMLCVTVVVAGYMAGILRKPLLALALLVLCFPVSGVVWMGLACVIGAALPIPRVLT